MPPSSRRKKAQRSFIHTHNFFNQAGSTVCPCCGEPNHDPATDVTNSCDTNPYTTEIIRSSIASLWKERYEKLTTKQHQGVNSAIKSQLAIANPLGVLQELKLSHKGLSNVPTATIANQFRAMESYDLGNLDKVAEEFDELCIGTKDEEERKMASTAMLIGEFSSITCDKTNLLEDRLSTALDLFNLNIHSMIVIPLTSCIRQAQLFNVEKRFGCVEESYRALRHENEGKGEMFVSLPPSYRQKLDNPYKPEEPTPELRKEGRKKKKKKPPGAFKALLALQATAKLAIKDMQEIKQTLRNIEKQPYTIPKPPPYFTYADVPVPEDVPEHIRQRFFDAEFAYEEVLALQNEASKQLNKVRSAFAAWDNAGTEVWETGIKHIHEMPTFREYEHTRISLQAMFTIASRQEVKIVEFYSSEGAPELPPAMNEAFRLKAMSLEEFKEDWETRLLLLQSQFPPVDKILEEALKTDKPRTEWWKWLVENSA